MLTVSALTHGDGFSISMVTCRDDQTGWSEPEEQDGYDVVLVRQGRFRHSADGCSVDLDRTLGYLRRPGGEERFAHPWGGDVCTWIRLEASLWQDLAGDHSPSVFPIDAGLDLTHRRMLAATRALDTADEVTHHLHALLASILIRRDDRAPREADRAIVCAAREAILLDHPNSRALTLLAAALGVSPFRLSRAFSRQVGVPMTQYRNRVRLARVLDRLEQGENELARLAAELGFADQGHLCRNVRQQLGHTPTALRRMLSS